MVFFSSGKAREMKKILSLKKNSHTHKHTYTPHKYTSIKHAERTQQQNILIFSYFLNKIEPKVLKKTRLNDK